VVSRETGNFTIDNTEPVSSVEALPPYTRSASFTVRWNGSDTTSGIEYYEVYYSVDGGAFTKWVTTANTSAVFTGMEGHRYGFYSIGVDRAQNRENKSTEDTWTRVDAVPPVTSLRSLPKYENRSEFDVAYDVVDASPVDVTLYYRVDGGSWEKYGVFNASPIRFKSGGQGVYEFYIEGEDAAGNKEVKGQQVEARTIVDTESPHVRITLKKSLVNVSEVLAYYDASDNYELQEIRIEYSKSNDNMTWGKWVTGYVYPGGGSKSISKSGLVKVEGSGYYRLRSSTIDGANNTDTGSGYVYFRVDTDPPEIVSAVPADGAYNVSLTVEVRIGFSEPMNRASVEKGIVVSNVSGGIMYAWDQTSSVISFTLEGLEENSTYTITILGSAQDLAGNRITRSEITFRTVSLHGGITGHVIGSNGVYIRGARVTLYAENGSMVMDGSADGDGVFRFDGVPGGNYTIRGSASGYHAGEVKVKVIPGYTVSADLVLEKDDTMMYIGAGIGAGVLVFLLLLFLLLLKKGRKCPQCGTRVGRGVKTCPKCHADLSRRTVRRRQPVPSAEKPVAIAAGADIYTPEVPVKCPSCKQEVPAGEEWCPNCGTMVKRPEGAKECTKCGGTIIDGVCIACGYSEGVPPLLPEEDMTRPGEECPRCYAPIEKGAKFCSVCGGDIARLLEQQKMKEKRIAEMKEDAKPGAKIDLGQEKHAPGSKEGIPGGKPGVAPSRPEPAGAPPPIPKPEKSTAKVSTHAGEKKHAPGTPPPVVAPVHKMPGQPVCRTCNSPLPPGAKWCDICGEKV
jgi:predicted amidophosphoribosyltransferase